MSIFARGQIAQSTRSIHPARTPRIAESRSSLLALSRQFPKLSVPRRILSCDLKHRGRFVVDVLLAIGTRKGLWLGRSRDGRGSWELSQPMFPMTDVHAVAIDTTGSWPRVFAAVTNEHFGPTVVTSDDLGVTWDEPDHAPIAFPEDTGAALAGVWQIVPKQQVVYAGVEPSALFRSTDGGRTFELVRALWEHPHRKNWTPGGGGMMIHTILPHPT